MLGQAINITLVILWGMIAWFIVARSWRSRHYRIGVTVAYVSFFAIAHWLPMIVISLPWYEPLYEEELNWLGFYQSLVAISSFAFGALGITWFLKDFHRKKVAHSSARTVFENENSESQLKLPLFYVMIGLFFTFIVSPVAGSIPTLSAFFAGLNSLFQVGILLLLWQGLHRNSRWQIAIAWIVILLWPIITIVGSGFLGMGVSIVVFFVVFFSHLIQRPSKHVLAFAIFGYIGISFAISYWTIREDIRGTIWYGNSDVSISSRTNLVGDLINSFQLFDISNPEHLAPIDVRANFNYLTGLTIIRINDNIVDYAYGDTIFDAMLMVVPRAVWPDKPVGLGGDDIVEQYAGVGLLRGSLSPGHLMELYLNFGTIGVVFGFALLGTLVGFVDNLAAGYLKRHDLFNFALMIVPALSLLQVTDSFVALVGGSVSGFLTIYVANVVFRSLFFEKAITAESGKSAIRTEFQSEQK